MNLAAVSTILDPSGFIAFLVGPLWSAVKLFGARTPVGETLGKKPAYRKIPYGALWGSSSDMVLPTLWLNGRGSENTSDRVPAGLWTNCSKPQGRELERGNPPYYTKRQNGPVSANIYSSLACSLYDGCRQQ